MIKSLHAYTVILCAQLTYALIQSRYSQTFNGALILVQQLLHTLPLWICHKPMIGAIGQPARFCIL